MTIKIKLRPATANETEGTLTFNLTLDGTNRRLTTSHRLRPEEWDAERSKPILPPSTSSRHAAVRDIADSIAWECKRIEAIVMAQPPQGQGQELGQCKRIDSVVSELRLSQNTDSVFTFVHKQVLRLRRMRRMSSSNSLQSALEHFMAFRHHHDLSFSMFTDFLMQEFEAYLSLRGLRRNSTSCYMRALRSCYNLAIEKRVTSNALPFRHVYTGKDKTAKRAMTIEQIRAIKNLDLSKRPRLDFARDMFMFSFYARGMSFVDMAFLRKTDLVEGYFSYYRRKTGQLLSIEWLSDMQRILNKYASNSTPYLLPIITQKGKDPRRQYLTKAANITRSLKRISAMAKIPTVITMYRARHSWATCAQRLQVPIGIISQALGHDCESTTRIYLAGLDAPLVDRATREIIKHL